MEFIKQNKIFLQKAKVDLRISKILLKDFNNGDEELDLDSIMFHLQQSAEKSMKSLLSFNTVEFSKTHDLGNLIKIIKKHNIPFIDNYEILIDLTIYAVEGRYAIIHDDLDDADKYIKILDELLEFVEKEVKL